MIRNTFICLCVIVIGMLVLPFVGTLLALEYNGMTLYDIILSPQSSVLNRIG